ncbi:inositol 1,4,5-triphosphate receptor associated 1 [Heptranchias perlo]|uniref:inositol 1,4,5-triphosphate receptor associated 1 n=1 Tax=Heptranchias perlo TaxID=212740 RepID=UPI003559D32F
MVAMLAYVYPYDKKDMEALEKVGYWRQKKNVESSFRREFVNFRRQKQETDAWSLSRDVPVQLHQQSLGIHTALCIARGSSGSHTPLLDALSLEPCWTRQPFGSQSLLRPLSRRQCQAGGDHHSPSKWISTEERETKTTNRNDSSRAVCQEAVGERGSSPEIEAQLPEAARSEDKGSAQCSSLRTLLSRFTLPGFDSSCRLVGSLTRSPHCIVPPAMPTLPEEEEGTEHQDRTQGSPASVRKLHNRTCVFFNNEANIPISDLMMEGRSLMKQLKMVLQHYCFQAFWVTINMSTKYYSQEAGSHSPIQRRSSRPSRSSLSSSSSLTSVDGDGHVYDLVNDELPDVELSDEDMKKNANLLVEAKKISEMFLTRRNRRTRNSSSDSPTALTPSWTPLAAPAPSRSNSASIQPQIGSDTPTAISRGTTVVPSTQGGETPPRSPNRDKEMKKHTRKLSPAAKIVEGRRSSPVAMGSQPAPSAKSTDASVEQKEPTSLGTDPCRESKPLDKTDHAKAEHSKEAQGAEGVLGCPTKLRALKCKVSPLRSSWLLDSDSAAPKADQAASRSRMPCRAEIKSFSSQPLLHALSWECLEIEGEPSSPPKSPTVGFRFDDAFDSSQLKAPNCEDVPVQPKMQKLAKLREENKLMRSQNLSALRLPDLSETIEQERGPSPTPCPADDESKGNSEVTPNIPDSLLRKLKVHRSLPGGLPPLTEKEIENTFIQLSLAFKNDSYTLETRLGLAERERNLAEDNTEKELENFKAEMKTSTSLWVHSDHRDAHQRLLETIAVLQRLATRLSGRAEMVGAVRQERRMSKATEVMMQYVENLKRMYEKDHAELTEFKKLANQNSNRSYGPYGDNGDDGIPRTARSMSLTLGKAMPRRRVSVAVVPKFINFPSQPASSSTLLTITTMPEPNNNNSSTSSSSTVATTATTSPSSANPSSTSPITSSRIGIHPSPTLAPLVENGKQNGDQERKHPAPGEVQTVKVAITSSETKAKIEEEAYKKGYQEGLKAKLSQEQKELREEPEKVVERSAEQRRSEERRSEERNAEESSAEERRSEERRSEERRSEERNAEQRSAEERSEPGFKEERKSSKFEEVSDLMDRLCPECLKQRSAIWIVGAVILLFAVLISLFTSLRYPCGDLSNSPSEKSSSSPVQKYLWPFSGSCHKTRAQV